MLTLNLRFHSARVTLGYDSDTFLSPTLFCPPRLPTWLLQTPMARQTLTWWWVLDGSGRTPRNATSPSSWIPSLESEAGPWVWEWEHLYHLTAWPQGSHLGSCCGDGEGMDRGWWDPRSPCPPQDHLLGMEVSSAVLPPGQGPGAQRFSPCWARADCGCVWSWPRGFWRPYRGDPHWLGKPIL